MKIQCNACESTEAAVLCCADDAALCTACDEKVHAANKLAGKHQRVPLLGGGSSPRVPMCDICQEAAGYFFCLEDRALLCRQCDVAIHTANHFVSAHQRFLVTGVQVGLEPIEPVPSVAMEGLNSSERVVESSTKSLPEQSPSISQYGETKEIFSSQVGKDGALATSKSSFSGINMAGGLTDWHMDDLFGLTDFGQHYGFNEQGFSKADSGKFGSPNGSSPYPSNDAELEIDECLSQAQEVLWTVPEIPSPPTTSGLHWQRNIHYPASEDIAFVPDISYSSPDLHSYRWVPAGAKRRRPC